LSDKIDPPVGGEDFSATKYLPRPHSFERLMKDNYQSRKAASPQFFIYRKSIVGMGAGYSKLPACQSQLAEFDETLNSYYPKNLSEEINYVGNWWAGS
jgi:hypothetical protein